MYYTIIINYSKRKQNTYFCSKVNAQPSTTTSWVAAMNEVMKNTNTSLSIFGFPVSGNKSLIS